MAVLEAENQLGEVFAHGLFRHASLLFCFLWLDWISAFASLLPLLLVKFANFLLYTALLAVLNDQVELVLGRVVDDLVQFADVGMVKLLHDGHFLLDVVKCAKCYRNCLAAQSLLVHDFHGVDVFALGVDICAHEYL